MFFITYKTTVRNLVRSPLFWMMFILFGLHVFDRVPDTLSTGYYDPEINEMITPADPTYIYEFIDYVQGVANTINRLMYYIVPLFTVVSVVLILNRDYGDNFYEIEKAAGLKPTQYLFGRLFALFTVNIIVTAVISVIVLHLEVFIIGGVAGFDMWTYITDSTVRMLRHLIFRVIPALIFYIGFTYCVGSLLRSGIAAAVCSIGYVVFYAVTYLMLRHRVPPVYFDYLAPNPRKLSMYLHFYDSDPFQFNSTVKYADTNLTKAAICVCILVGLGVLYSAIAYLRTRKRDR